MNGLAQLTPAQPRLSVVRKEQYYAMSETELVRACQNRNQDAFEALVHRYQRTVYGHLYKLAPDWNDTADLTQEVLIRIWRSLPALRDPRAFRRWLNQLVTNLFYDELRKRPKGATISIDESLKSDESEENITRDIPDESAMPDEVMQRHELSAAINDAIDKLPCQFRQVIVLRELEGLSYDEIAEITSSEIGTVKSRIARARAKVQNLLEAYVKAS
ncbi:MAG TPA: sigma-70 family RNA polymerase sigma factor [Oculatellaceae cyanobacterium]